MKAHLQKLTRSIHQNCSFSLDFQSHQFLKVWHYHPEPELAIILNGNVTLNLGDGNKNLCSGDMVLIGENAPHHWQIADTNKNFTSFQPKAVVIHFMESFSKCLIKAPEFGLIRELFADSKKGIFFGNIDINEILGIMNLLKACQDFERVIMILEVLKLMVSHENKEFISCGDFSMKNGVNTDNKLDKLYHYVQGNFKEGINLQSAANTLNMNPSSFSRFFKKIHQKTFTQYVNEIKIGYACQILMEKDMNISEACYESGFKNISNFNRKFREIKKVSPSQFLKNHNLLSE
jgi:AraC-like DNA-binding protein